MSRAWFRRCSFLFATFALAGVCAAQTQSLRAWNIHAEGYPVTEALKSFADEVSKATNGKYKIEVFSNGVLGDQPKAVKMLKDGEIDLGEFSSGSLTDAVPGLRALNLPFLFNDSEHMFRHLDGKLGEAYAEKLGAAGYVVLGWYDGGARSFYCSNRSVTNIQSLSGARIRVQQSEIFLELVRQLGAQPVSVPFKDVLGAFQTDKIDCAENNMPSYESTGHYKHARNVYLTNHVVSPEVLVVSAKVWNGLSAAEKTIFQKAGKASALYMRDLWKRRVTVAIEATTKQGSQFVRVKDVAPFIVRMQPLYKKYMADPVTRNEVLTIIGN
jgi:tripartite ATP-independent transporter DctP family solute receptor